MRGENQGLLFSYDSGWSWGGFSFSFQFGCKTVIEAYRFHLHLSPPLLSLWSAACLPGVCASWHCWFLYDILSGTLVLHCSSVLMYMAIKFKPKRGKAQSQPPPSSSLCCPLQPRSHTPFNHCRLPQLSLPLIPPSSSICLSFALAFCLSLCLFFLFPSC